MVVPAQRSEKEPAMPDTDTDTDTGPSAAIGPSGLVGLHHVGITVTDIQRSLRWYGEMLGMVQWGEEHYPGGRTALLMRPGTHLHLGLDVHEANQREPFEPHRTGMDHLCLAVTSRSKLVEWHEHLTARGVDCSDIRDVTIKPISASLFTFVDPDGVALEMMYVENPG
jgi:glyoxylase I family protein